MLNTIDKNKYIHMVGIGGVSMSGIAEILLSMALKSLVQTTMLLIRQSV